MLGSTVPALPNRRSNLSGMVGKFRFGNTYGYFWSTKYYGERAWLGNALGERGLDFFSGAFSSNSNGSIRNNRCSFQKEKASHLFDARRVGGNFLAGFEYQLRVRHCQPWLWQVQKYRIRLAFQLLAKPTAFVFPSTHITM